ncbi:hypothetical protein, partial [Nocardioides sp.]|uniref:hypothetical protein n=1 Tax=Nocardioides sp. TaxID=35761 RepID=UPI00273770DF
TGAIVLETAGRRWATERVQGRGRSISNGLTIPSFARAHADPLRGRIAQCGVRRQRTQAAAEQADGVLALLGALRDHGGEAPRWSRVNGVLSAPCAHAAGLITTTQSTASWVADLREAPRHWVTGTSAPCTSLAKPVRVEEPADIDPEAMPTGQYDAAYRWWRHERLHRRAIRDLPAALSRYAAERDRIEREWCRTPPGTEEAFAAADALEARWLADLERAEIADARPRWLRRRWRTLDRAADLPEVE